MGIELNKNILFVSFIRFLGNHKMIDCILFFLAYSLVLLIVGMKEIY